MTTGARHTFRASITLAFTVGLIACTGSAPMDAMGGDPGAAADDHDPEAPAFAALLKGQAQNHALCARGNSDAVARGLCASGDAPKVASLTELQHAVGLFDAGPPQFALTAHSTSLVARSVSALNPRAIIFTPPIAAPNTQPNDGSFIQDPGFVAMGFVRGEQLVELVAHDAQRNELHFYLVRFTQACNGAGCTHGDLLTPAVEREWTSVTVYEDRDLKNTQFDCLHCHQPDGPSARKLLRMQERRAPWTHWLRNNQNEPGGVSLLADFQAAHGKSEDYAGIPAALLDTPRSDPLVLEALIDNNSLSPQPNEFPTARVEQQVQASAPQQPNVNDPMGHSSAWDSIYRHSVDGTAIPVPYHDVKVTDPQKLATMSAAYRQVASGALARGSLPDIRDVFLDGALPDLSFVPRAGLDGGGILVQMCQRCHNPSLDQTISRARFDVTKLATLDRAEKDAAIARLQLAAGATQRMPPARFGALSPDEIQAAVKELQK